HRAQCLAHHPPAPQFAGDDVTDVAAPMRLPPFIVPALADQPVVTALSNRPVDAGAFPNLLRDAFNEPAGLIDSSEKPGTPVLHGLFVGENTVAPRRP